MRKEKKRQLEKVLKKYDRCTITSKFIAKAIMKDKRNFISGLSVGQMIKKYDFEQTGSKTEPKRYLIDINKIPKPL